MSHKDCYRKEISELLKNPDDPSMELMKVGLRADKEIEKHKNMFNDEVEKNQQELEAKDKLIAELSEDLCAFQARCSEMIGVEKERADWERKYNQLSDYTNQIKADAIEGARLSIIIHSPAREGTFLDGADWAFDDMSKQLENRVSELTNNKEGE